MIRASADIPTATCSMYGRTALRCGVGDQTGEVLLLDDARDAHPRPEGHLREVVHISRRAVAVLDQVVPAVQRSDWVAAKSSSELKRLKRRKPTPLAWQAEQ